MEEIWKDIVGYGGVYQVSNFCKVKSVGNAKNKSEKILKMSSYKGYLRVRLYNNGIWKIYLSHRLVAIEFIENPLNLPCVCHIDETLMDGLLDNSVGNLFWGTHKDNMRDMVNKGRWKSPMQGKFGTDHPNTRIIIQKSLSGEKIREWIGGAREVTKTLGYDDGNIRDVCIKRRGRTIAYGFMWDYKL